MLVLTNTNARVREQREHYQPSALGIEFPMGLNPTIQLQQLFQYTNELHLLYDSLVLYKTTKDFLI